MKKMTGFMIFILSSLIFLTVGVLNCYADDAKNKKKKDIFEQWAEENPKLALELDKLNTDQPEWRDNVWNDEQKALWIMDNSERYPGYATHVRKYAEQHPDAAVANWRHEKRFQEGGKLAVKNREETKYIEDYGKKHDGIVKQGYQDPKHSEELMKKSAKHNKAGKEWSKKAAKNKEKSKKAWNNYDKTKEKAKEKKKNREKNQSSTEN